MADTQIPSHDSKEIAVEAPSQEKRTMATMAHVLQLVGWWIAPLVIFAVKRQSKFVSFHALQALLLQIVHMVLIGAFMVAWFTLIFSAIVMHPLPKNAPLPPAIFFCCLWYGWSSWGCGHC